MNTRTPGRKTTTAAAKVKMEKRSKWTKLLVDFHTPITVIMWMGVYCRIQVSDPGLDIEGGAGE